MIVTAYDPECFNTPSDLIDFKTACNTMRSYFDALAATGYVKKSVTCKMLIYLFLLEWITSDISYFISDEDYAVLRKALQSLYGDCLLPYPVYCINRMKLGSPMIMDASESLHSRMTEDASDNITRKSEDAYTRIVEHKTMEDN